MASMLYICVILATAYYYIAAIPIWRLLAGMSGDAAQRVICWIIYGIGIPAIFLGLPLIGFFYGTATASAGMSLVSLYLVFIVVLCIKRNFRPSTPSPHSPSTPP